MQTKKAETPEPYVHQEFPKSIYHPGLGVDESTKHAKAVIVRDEEHMKAVIAEQAENGLDESEWRPNPKYFGKPVPKSDSEKAAEAEDQAAALADENAKLKALIAELQSKPGMKVGKGKDEADKAETKADKAETKADEKK